MNNNTSNNYSKGMKIFFTASAFIFLILIFLSFKNPGSVSEDYVPPAYGSIIGLIPPVVAIVLAFITKEAYSALIIGIFTGAAIYSAGNLELCLNTILYHDTNGMIAQLSDSSHAGILVFVASLGIMVKLLVLSGGSEAFGNLASKHIRTKKGASLATVLLGMLIFVDDGFNCMAVGTIMRPLTERLGITRAKLAYIIDATAAPVCIIAPISSWAAAVSYSLPVDMDINGFSLFLRTIPYNLYALVTLFMVLCIIFMDFDFGPMAKTRDTELKEASSDFVHNELKEDAGTGASRERELKVSNLVVPVAVLIASCITGMIYTGGFFDGETLQNAFANADGARGLVTGSAFTLVFTFFFYSIRKVVSFRSFMDALPEGWGSFVRPMIILILAWTLSGMTDLLGARYYIRDIMAASAGSLQMMLPFIIFIVSALLAFSTGTSWGTFSILIPIACNAFDPSNELFVITIAACLAGAVCGDHCSPISDTTIMSSAGAMCPHMDHVTTQLPYALLSASVAGVGYIAAGAAAYYTGSSANLISLPIALILIFIILKVLKSKFKAS